jgi:hypothetical protein
MVDVEVYVVTLVLPPDELLLLPVLVPWFPKPLSGVLVPQATKMGKPIRAVRKQTSEEGRRMTKAPVCGVRQTWATD